MCRIHCIKRRTTSALPFTISVIYNLRIYEMDVIWLIIRFSFGSLIRLIMNWFYLFIYFIYCWRLLIEKIPIQFLFPFFTQQEF